MIALSALSLSNNMDLDIFFNPSVIEKIFGIANKLDHRSNLLAMDALRNLMIQAYLIDRYDMVEKLMN